MDGSDQTVHTNFPRDAFSALRPEILAVPEEGVPPITLDVAAAITVGLSAHKRIVAFRDEIAKLPGFDMAKFDKLPSYIYATSYAHTQYVMATTPPAVLPVLEGEGVALYELMLSSALNLGKFGLVDTAPLNGLKGVNGYRNIAVGLTVIADFLRANLAKIQGKTPITLQDLDKAEGLAMRLFEAIGDKDTSPASAAEATLTRQRAFSLFDDAYDQARRAIIYLRWDHGDADEVAPSLYSTRNNSRKRAAGDTTAPDAPVVPPPVTTTPATPAIPAVPVGHQGGSPLLP